MESQSPPLVRIQKTRFPLSTTSCSVELGGSSHIPISSQNDFVNNFVNIATDSSPTVNPQISPTTLAATPRQLMLYILVERRMSVVSYLTLGTGNSRPYGIVVQQGVFYLITCIKAYQISLKQNCSLVQSR